MQNNTSLRNYSVSFEQYRTGRDHNFISTDGEHSKPERKLVSVTYSDLRKCCNTGPSEEKLGLIYDQEEAYKILILNSDIISECDIPAQDSTASWHR